MLDVAEAFTAMDTSHANFDSQHYSSERLSQLHCPGSETEDFYPFHNSFPAARDSLENI